jgi:hypothetical protein
LESVQFTGDSLEFFARATAVPQRLPDSIFLISEESSFYTFEDISKHTSINLACGCFLLPSKMPAILPGSVDARNKFEDLSGVDTRAFSNPYDALIEACQDDPV